MYNNNVNDPNEKLFMLYLTEIYPFVLYCAICNESFRYTKKSKMQLIVNHNRQYGHLCKLLEQCETQEIANNEFRERNQSFRIFSEDEIRFYSRNRNGIAFKSLLSSKVDQIEELRIHQSKELYLKEKNDKITAYKLKVNKNQMIELENYKKFNQANIDPIAQSDLFQRYLIDLLNCNEFLLFLFLFIANRLELEVNELLGLTFKELTKCCIPIVATPQGKIERSIIKTVDNQDDVKRIIESYLSVFPQNSHKEVLQLSYPTLKQILDCNKREMKMMLPAQDYEYKCFIQNIYIKGIKNMVLNEHQATIIVLFFDQKYKKSLRYFERNSQLNNNRKYCIKQEEDLIHQNMIKEDDEDDSLDESEDVIYIETKTDANASRPAQGENWQNSPFNQFLNSIRGINNPNQNDEDISNTRRPNQNYQTNHDTETINGLNPRLLYQNNQNEIDTKPPVQSGQNNSDTGFNQNDQSDSEIPLQTCLNNRDAHHSNQISQIESQSDPILSDLKYKQNKERLLRLNTIVEQGKNKRTKTEP